MSLPTPTTPEAVADYLDRFRAPGTPCLAEVTHTHRRCVTALGEQQGRIVWRLGQQAHWDRLAARQATTALTARRRLPEARTVLAAICGRHADPCPEITRHRDTSDALARASHRAKAGRP